MAPQLASRRSLSVNMDDVLAMAPQLASRRPLSVNMDDVLAMAPQLASRRHYLLIWMMYLPWHHS